MATYAASCISWNPDIEGRTDTWHDEAFRMQQGACEALGWKFYEVVEDRIWFIVPNKESPQFIWLIVKQKEGR